MRASNIVYETPEGRPFWKLRPLQILVTLVMVMLLALLALSLVLTGPVVDQVAGPLGISDAAMTVWDIAKWPVMLVVVLLMIGVLFHAAPNVKLPGFKWVTPGARPRARRVDRRLRRCSPSTSRTSAPTTRRTARSAASSRCSCGCGSRTSRCCSGWS